MGIKHQVLLPAEFAGATRYRFGGQVGMLQLDVWTKQRSDGADDARIQSQMMKGRMTRGQFQQVDGLMFDPTGFEGGLDCRG